MLYFHANQFHFLELCKRHMLLAVSKHDSSLGQLLLAPLEVQLLLLSLLDRTFLGLVLAPQILGPILFGYILAQLLDVFAPAVNHGQRSFISSSALQKLYLFLLFFLL